PGWRGGGVVEPPEQERADGSASSEGRPGGPERASPGKAARWPIASPRSHHCERRARRVTPALRPEHVSVGPVAASPGTSLPRTAGPEGRHTVRLEGRRTVGLTGVVPPGPQGAAPPAPTGPAPHGRHRTN